MQLTDDDGNVIKNYDYDPYGNALHDDDAQDKNPYRYCGEYLDFESGYVYLRARYYDPAIGRFISEDPAFDGCNWYAYCGGNPVNRWDPSGLSFVDDFAECWKIGIGMLRESGTAGNIFASYSEGVVDGLNNIGQAISDPIGSIKVFAEDPLKPIKSIGDFYTNLATASYNHDWGSVAYSLGGASANVAVTGVTAWATAGIAGAVAPNGINYSVGMQGIMQGGSLALSPAIAFSISSAQVGAISAVAFGSNIMFAKKSRPSYGKNQVDDVWNANVDPKTGTAKDPSGSDITWDKSKPRNGQWDMGHKRGHKYSDVYQKYINGEITKEEFKAWYKDPNNYRPELPSTNRSHKYE